MSFEKGRERADELKEKAISEMNATELERKRLEFEERRIAAQERQLTIQEQQAATMATQMERTAPKENPHYIAAGPFTDPTGAPWSKRLKCEMFDGPIDLRRAETLTEAEVTQLNRLQPLEAGTLTRTDDLVVKARVLPTYDAVGRLAKLVIERPMQKQDGQHNLYPPLREMARQLADQAEKQPVAG